VQLITFLALLSFPFLALWFAPNLLLGVFDIMPWGMVFVTLGATLASWDRDGHRLAGLPLRARALSHPGVSVWFFHA